MNNDIENTKIDIISYLLRKRLDVEFHKSLDVAEEIIEKIQFLEEMSEDAHLTTESNPVDIVLEAMKNSIKSLKIIVKPFDNKNIVELITDTSPAASVVGEKHTNRSGIAIFEEVLVGVDYVLYVNRDGYKPYELHFTIHQNDMVRKASKNVSFENTTPLFNKKENEYGYKIRLEKEEKHRRL